MGKSKELATLTDVGGTIGDDLSIEVTDWGGLNVTQTTSNKDPLVKLISPTTNYWSHQMDSSSGDSLQWRYNNTTQMQIDASGRVTMPYQLHIEGTPNRSGAGFANAFYTRNTPVGLSFSNERITVPIAGRYLVCWNTIADSGSGRVDTNIYINGVQVVNSMGESYNNAFRFRGSAHVFNLAANDYIQFFHQDYYNSGLSSRDNWNNASVTLLG